MYAAILREKWRPHPPLETPLIEVRAATVAFGTQRDKTLKLALNDVSLALLRVPSITAIVGGAVRAFGRVAPFIGLGLSGIPTRHDLPANP